MVTTGNAEFGDESSGVVVIVSDCGEGALSFLAETVRQAGRTPRLLTGEGTSDRTLASVGAVFDAVAALPDPADPAALARGARELAGGPPAALFTWHDPLIVPVAHAAELLGLRGTAPDALLRCRHKYAARRALRDAGLSSPGFALLSDAADAARVAAEVGLPAVIKPVNGTSSSLVRRVEDVAGLAAAYRELAAAAGDAVGGVYRRPLPGPDAAAPLDPTTTFLVEGLLSGPEYSVEVVVRAGVAEQVLVLDKFLVDEHFFERGFCWPPLALPADRAATLATTVAGAVRALGLTDTTAHVEIMDDPVLGPTVVEVNAGRPGGQIIGLLTTLGTGVDLRAEHLAMLLGDPPPARSTPKLPPPLATLTLYADTPGRLVRIDGLDDVEDHPDVIITVPVAKPGDVLVDDHETFPLNILVAGPETRDELLATYRELDAMVTFVTEPV